MLNHGQLGRDFASTWMTVSVSGIPNTLLQCSDLTLIFSAFACTLSDCEKSLSAHHSDVNAHGRTMTGKVGHLRLTTIVVAPPGVVCNVTSSQPVNHFSQYPFLTEERLAFIVHNPSGGVIKWAHVAQACAKKRKQGKMRHTIQLKPQLAKFWNGRANFPPPKPETGSRVIHRYISICGNRNINNKARQVHQMQVSLSQSNSTVYGCGT